MMIILLIKKFRLSKKRKRKIKRKLRMI